MMKVEIHDTKQELGRAAAEQAARKIKQAIRRKGDASIIVATGASQFEILESLINSTGIDWSKLIVFHLDEYLGMTDTHPASFRKFLKERFVSKLPALKAVHLVEGDASDPHKECKRLKRLISLHPVDVALVGIGENGHLAFNDPPADFQTEEPYIIVELDKVCRRQQMGEGWFDSVDEVPAKAISMSVKQVMKSRAIICSVPDKRKAVAVRNCLEGDVSPKYPSSILQHHEDCTVYLDRDSASLLSGKSHLSRS